VPANAIHHAPSQSDFAAIRRALPEASHVPGEIYYSSDIFALEKARIFTREWCCVGRSEEIAHPGDYMAIRLVGEPIVVTRNLEGELRCFANVCLHRGVEVAQDSGNTRIFSCPYHAWTYDLDGRLTAAGFMKESLGFDTTSRRLKPIRVGEWAGWIFVNLDENAAPLSEHLEDFARDTAVLRMENCRIGSKIDFPAQANWKFVVENVLDVYHSRTLHYKSFGKHRGSPEKYPFHLRKNGGTCTVYEGKPKTPDGVTLFRKMPALEDRPDNFAMSCHLAPNIQLVARIDSAQVFVAWPDTETTSHFVVYSLFAKEFFDLPDFAERVRVYDDYTRLFLGEDSVMLTSLQQAMQSVNYVPGRLSTLEIGVHHILNDYLNRLHGPDRSQARAAAGRPG